MNKYLLFLLLFTSNCFAQNIIKGKIIDDITKEAVVGASVYINNSSIGATTDSLGQFHFVTSFGGEIELIASHLAYQKKRFLVKSEEASHLIITLQKQDHTLNEIVISTKKRNTEDLQKWKDLFTLNLIGTYSQAGFNCVITNPEVLVYDFNKENNELKVYASAPIIVENKIIAYKIRLDLELFTYSFKTSKVYMSYSAFFEDLPISIKKKEQISQLRNLYYYGSNMHFLRSVYAGNLEAEGYQLNSFTMLKNLEKQRVQAIIQRKTTEAYAMQKSPNLTLEALIGSTDSLIYYRIVLNQNDAEETNVNPVSMAQLTKFNDTLKTVRFYSKDTLQISFAYTLEQLKKIIPEVRKQAIAESRPKHPTNSYLYFFDSAGIEIEKNGYFAGLKALFYGNMGQRRVSGLLPFDYDPNQN